MRQQDIGAMRRLGARLRSEWDAAIPPFLAFLAREVRPRLERAFAAGVLLGGVAFGLGVVLLSSAVRPVAGQAERARAWVATVRAPSLDVLFQPPRRSDAAAPAPTRPLLAVASWLLVIAAGAATGAGISLYRVWMVAETQVAAYLAAPPQTTATVVWSAPIEVHVGQPVHLDALGDDLLAAGLDRAPSGPALAPGQFRVEGDLLEAVTDAGEPVRIVTKGGKVTRVEPARLVLPPTPLATVGDPDSHRTPVHLAQISPFLEPALVSMEDERFRSHIGIDVVGIARAVLSGVAKEELQGGSTITQQLAKNLFLTPERSLRRKVHEAFYALALESALTKDELLERYLSEIYLGQMGTMPLRGVEAASRAWFGRSVAALDVAQAATIVGVIPAPNAWSPVRNPEGALQRRNLVLQKMAADGILTADQLAEAVARPLGIDGLEPSRIRRAPYAVDAALAEALMAMPSLDGGQALFTGIQPVLQRAAEDAVTEGLAELVRAKPDLADAQAALVAVRLSDGAVVAMVGGRSYVESPFNRATDGHRQVGSTVKPFTMLAAVERHVAGPNTLLDDAPISRRVMGETWSPRNYDGQFLGPMTVRRVIERSRNVPSILLAEQVGWGRLRDTLRASGFSEPTALPSTALGAFRATPLEMAGAWTVFDDGVAERPHVLVSAAEASGAPIALPLAEGARVASEDAAAVATKVLEGVLRGGTGSRSAKYGVGPPAAGKSGTTDEYRDAWFVGLTHEYAVAVWVGRDEGLLGLPGSEAALPTWSRFVAATAGSKAPRTKPDGVVSVEICEDTGLRALETCEHKSWDWVLKSMVPAECSGVHPVLPGEEEDGALHVDALVDEAHRGDLEGAPAGRGFWTRRRDRAR